MTLDVAVVGRIGIDLYPLETGASLAEVRTFRKLLGGSAANVAVAAARLGLSAGLVSKVGRDGFGDFARSELRRLGVDDRWVGVHPCGRTPVAFAELHPPDDFPLLFYRDRAAPDLQLTRTDLADPELASARVVWVTGGALSAEPSRAGALGLLRRRAASTLAILDLDYRPAMWDSPEEAGEWAREALADSDVVVGNSAEVATAVGSETPERQGERLLELGPRTAVVKLGPDGVLAMSGEGSWRIPAIPVEVVNGLGAGDAFGGALCFCLLQGRALPDAVAFANAAGAVVAGRFGCAEDMPTLAEVERLLATAPDMETCTSMGARPSSSIHAERS